MHDPTEGGVATALHELATASGTGLLAYGERMPILPEGRTLCEAFGLEPLGAIASGALLVAVAPEGAAALEAAYEAMGRTLCSYRRSAGRGSRHMAGRCKRSTASAAL